MTEPHRAKILITVKATPQPSGNYGDTSCVAGLRLDSETPTWVRLYPIPFRWLDESLQFKKYDVIDVGITRRQSDTRKESYTPHHNDWKTIERVDGWQRRHDIIKLVEPTTTCILNKAARSDTAAPSLGLVYPTDISQVSFEKHGAWTVEELGKMRDRMARESGALIPLSDQIPPVLKAPRFKVTYHYRCASPGCPGHRGRNLDWELTAFQNRMSGSNAHVKQEISRRFLDEMYASDRKTGFYVGNFERASQRSSFSVLGVYWPRLIDVAKAEQVLF